MFAVRIELMQALEIRSGAIMAPAALQRHPATIEQLGMIRPDCQSRSKPAKVSWRRPGVERFEEALQSYDQAIACRRFVENLANPES
jgi:hypothetical protein